MSVKTTIALLACALLLASAAAPAGAERVLRNQELLTISAEKDGNPPPEGEIEGACGLAVPPAPSGLLYVSDYYHRVVDVFNFAGQYQSEQVKLPGTNPVFGINNLDAVCGLAFDSAGDLYANEMHEAVLRLKPSIQAIDTGESTGVAGDAAGNLYVNDRTYVAKYEAPVEAGDVPVNKIGVDHLDDGYGLAAFGGKVYVPDAAEGTVKVFDPAAKLAEPVLTIDPPEGFTSLVDAAVAVDPTNGHLLVVDNSQPGFEHPLANIYEFESDGTFLGTLPRPLKAGKPTGPVFGEPSGIAVDPVSGELFVTDGNSEFANVFAYDPYTASGSMSTGAGSGSSAAPDTAGPGASPPPIPGANPGRAAFTSSVVRRGPVQVSFDGKLTPHALPRHGDAPVGISVQARISGTNGDAPPQLRKLAIAINRNGRLTTAGLPLCQERKIQPSTNAGALSACGDSLVGEGHFSANVKLPQQSPFPSDGKVLAFNGSVHGKPAILAHIYGTEPAPTSYVLPFLIRSSRGTYGSVLEASLPQATGNWGYVTGLRMKLHRVFRYRGRRRSYLSAGCPAPAGFPGAVFPLARTSFSFAGGPTLVSVLNRSCRAKG